MNKHDYLKQSMDELFQKYDIFAKEVQNFHEMNKIQDELDKKAIIQQIVYPYLEFICEMKIDTDKNYPRSYMKMLDVQHDENTHSKVIANMLSPAKTGEFSTELFKALFYEVKGY